DLIDEEDGILAFGLREGSGNVLLALSHPHRDEVGGAPGEDRHIKLAREPAAIGALAGSRRPIEAEPAGPRLGEAPRERGEIDVGVDELRVIDFGKPIGIALWRG